MTKNIQQNPDYARLFRGRPMRYVLPLNVPSEPVPADHNLVTLDDTRCTAHLVRGDQVMVTPEIICDIGCETPRIHYERYLGQPYRYFYAISSDVDVDNPGSVLKIDTKTGTWKSWNKRNVYPSEPIFVSSPEPKWSDYLPPTEASGVRFPAVSLPDFRKWNLVGRCRWSVGFSRISPVSPALAFRFFFQSEDDGVVLSALIWSGDRENQAGVLILDASTMTEIARAEFTTPSAVPKCLHGWFTEITHKNTKT
ncbi:hypothetical protein PR048_011968 [Dryococelus australis]|uniref:Uncharacterized protein n=1 Tax=Dryococelus australis TaxID=614101 RepID=A0ABQ9HN41_9NEOP|nr:hypothetical protein PR048_011968 [Dryococelus australis]